MTLASQIQKLVRTMEWKNRARTVPRAFHQGVVLSVDPDEGTAEVMIGDEKYGTVATIQKQSGFLPAVGDSVMMQMNGAEPVVTSPRQMVDGDMQSKIFTAGVAGWRITSDGDAEFNDVIVRGYVNNLKVHQPPLALLRHTGANYPLAIPDSTWTTLTDLAITRQNAPGPEGDPAYGLIYSNSGARVTPGRVGLWQLSVKTSWELNAAGNLRRLQLVNNGTGGAADLDIRGPQGGFILHNIHEPVEVLDITHSYHVRVFHDAGSDINIEMVKVLWEFKSD